MFFQFLLISSSFISLSVSQGQCTTPETLYNCYISYLGKYGVVPDTGYLPRVEYLLNQMMSHDLPVICKDFNELTACLGRAATYCVSFNTFYTYTDVYNQKGEAIAYLQNHAFFEFACGAGNQLFMQNLDCLQRSFQQISLTNRMGQCGQTTLSIDPTICPSTIAVTDCVRKQMTEACGESAGTASCGAAANIERRLDFLDAACLTEMDQRCSSCSISIISTLIFMILRWIL